jgi:RNA recognition motif. (a.k.a. RRM, RBD, or RNP domain)
MEAQIAQWQSAYAPSSSDADGGKGRGKPYNNYGTNPSTGLTGSNNAPLGSRPDNTGANWNAAAITSAADGDTGVASVVTGGDGKQKTVVRSGGGQTWQDPTLLEWDPAHFRLFVGNLAGEVTDESLLKAFSKYPSVQKARVVREKRTTKSKGYGFVSFSDGDEYFLAAREMQGKYIGSHPVLLRKSTTEIKATTPGDRRKGYEKGKYKGNQGGGKTGAGIKKGKNNKTKGGLNVLG